MDCLWLLMHFFHPIQQCAQHVYHTALPLSPTSSLLHKSCLQSVIDNQLSHVTAFSGAPDTWGLLLGTINVRPRQLTCITTSVQRIVIACEDIVSIYDAVTFVLQQSLHAPETVTKIQDSPDGSILFFAHSSSVTMWDVQTGGLIHTFYTRSKINDVAVSSTGAHIASGSSDGTVASWNIHTKEGRGFGNSQPVVAIHWLSSVELVVATQHSVYIGNIATIRTSCSLSFPHHVWGMVYLGGGKFIVGTSGQELYSLMITPPSTHQEWYSPTLCGQLVHQRTLQQRQQPTHLRQLMRPIHVENKIVCVTQPSGVQFFDIVSCNWTSSPPLLDAATSVALLSNRNLVVQAKDSIQIFSVDVLSGSPRNNVHLSHIYPLGEKHAICVLQPSKHLTLLELETLRELRPGDNASPLKSLLVNQSPSVHASFGRGPVAEFGTSVVMQAWRSGAPLPKWTDAFEEDVPLGGFSPKYTRIIVFYGSPRWELRVKDAKDRIILASLSLGDGDFGVGEVYDLTFDSETRFYLKIDKPGQHIQIPYDIVRSPSGHYSHTITRGKPVPLSEPRTTPPYTLDANCEWVVDAESRKICWISPGNLRRGNGGHFWAGLSLVMVGDDGVVRKLSFKKPADC